MCLLIPRALGCHLTVATDTSSQVSDQGQQMSHRSRHEKIIATVSVNVVGMACCIAVYRYSSIADQEGHEIHVMS